MSDYSYTQKDIEEARQYLLRRLDNEASMRKDIDNLLNIYAVLLIELLLNDGTDEDINELMQELSSKILNDCHTLGVDDRLSRSDDIIDHMNKEMYGQTLEDRILSRCETLFREITIVVIAGTLLQQNKETIISSVKGNFKHPYDNELIKAVKTKIDRGEISSDVDFTTPFFGHGVEISSYGALETITTHAIADAWMWYLFDENKDAKGYFVFRGSDYPCVDCDEAVLTGFHPISDTEHFVPLHLHCKCGIVFV